MARTWFGALTGVALALACAAPSHAIVGGEPAGDGWPALAALYLDDEFLCTGTLVRPDWILTARHCATDESDSELDPARLTAVVGKADITSLGGSDFVKTDQLILNDFGADAALMHLTAPQAAAPIKIVGAPDAARWAPGVKATILGYGATSTAAGGGDILRKTEITVRADNDCFLPGLFVGFNGDVDLCAGETTGGRDTCYGDSGGPLLVPDGSGGWLLAGATSRGVGCAVPTQYGLYVKLGSQPMQEWLAAKLPSVAPPSPPAEPRPIQVTLPAAAGRTGRLRAKVTASGTIQNVKLSLRGRGRTLAKGTASSLAGTKTIALKASRRVKPGRYTLLLRATDADGRAVRSERIVKVGR